MRPLTDSGEDATIDQYEVKMEYIFNREDGEEVHHMVAIVFKNEEQYQQFNPADRADA